MLTQRYCTPGTTCCDIPLEPRKVWKKTIASVLALFIVFIFLIVWGGVGIVSLLSAIGGNNTVGLFVLFFLIFLIAAVAILVGIVYLYQRVYFKNYFYNMLPDAIVIRKGVISRAEISLLYSKIQNVFVDQDVWDRIFKLYDVHLETAGLSSGVASHIDGLSAENAEKLRTLIMNAIKNAQYINQQMPPHQYASQQYGPGPAPQPHVQQPAGFR
jgi:membrane protein YdbS with pleckstrin-like domain